MKKVKDLTVQVTYRVGLGNLKMPDEVFEQLNEIAGSGDEIDASDMKYSIASEWISSKIREKDAYDWLFQIAELS